MINQTAKNNYRFEIADNQLTKTFAWQVQMINFPSVTLETARAVRSPKLSQTMIPGTATQYEDMQINFLIDENLEAYAELYSWLLTIQNPTGPTTETETNVPRTAILHIMDNTKSNVVCKFVFHKIYPKMLGEIEWSYTESGDVESMTCLTTFGYEYFQMFRIIDGQEVLVKPR